ncbi:AI-2E family transporter [Roseixanthobacter glucoisosaccharinicivorans]|uniref:AI-2E family transporter n=1 Tax=Roseixanthobacter glucoisosaccharinicivorans TaxID=3119923 RepID=UPI0037294EC3
MGFETRVARGVAVGCLVAAGFLVAWLVSDLILLIFAAVLIALALHALSEPIARVTTLPPRAALALAAFLVAVILAVTLYLFGSLIRAQVVELVQRLPQAWAEFRDRFGLAGLTDDLLRQAENAVPSGTTVLSVLRGFTSNVANVLLSLFLVVVGGIYIAIQPQVYRRGIQLIFPKAWRPHIDDALDRANIGLRNFLKAQLMAMVLVGVLSGVGLSIIGIPSAFALGLFAGLAEFVPMIGPVVAAVPALLLAFTVGYEEAAWTLALFVVVQQLEGNVISPLLQQEMVSIPPAVSLFAVVAVGTLLGPLGVLLATPLTVVVFAVWRREALAEPAGHGAAGQETSG